MTSTLLWVGLGVAALAGIMFEQNRRSRLARQLRSRAEWGRLRERARDMRAIASYHAARVEGDRDRLSLDDRTWEDLNMDDVFAVVDRTESVLGQQMLYSRLRTAPVADHLEAFETLVTRFVDDRDTRERAQANLSNLRDPAAYDLWWLAQPGVLGTEAWHVLFPVFGATMLGVVALIPFWPPAVLLLALGSLAGLIARGAVARHLGIVTGPFRQVGTLLAVAGRLRATHRTDTAAITNVLMTDLPRLSRLRRIAGWASRDSTGAAAGNLAALVFEYLNLVFSLDANALFFGARELRARGPELLRVIAAVGDLDAALSVASFRAGTAGWTRPVFIDAGHPARLSGISHPLLPDAVANSITLGPPHGMIITGSNMSGKSTFLRTVGVTVVLAQTINTCLADAYAAPSFVVRSCIGRADDPATGRSYYLMEVDSVLALVQEARATTPRLMLFDELFRGTNAVERIAAGEAVLEALVARGADGAQTRHVVVAATHDQELVDLLDGRYAPYHFTDRVDGAGLVFDYQIQPGPATTRNAIALLRMRGAPADLVEHALSRAATLDRARYRV